MTRSPPPSNAASRPSARQHRQTPPSKLSANPGILRPNARELAIQSLLTLKTLAENIVAHPNEDKFKKFKPTNSKIKRMLVDPKGTLEYAVAMGQSANMQYHGEYPCQVLLMQVVDFQPYYIFNGRHVRDLEIGLAIIHETLERELVKNEREERAKREAKEAEENVKEKVRPSLRDLHPSPTSFIRS
ncbi:hypothetical protein DAEQUDRAFT_113093 [Daedalea quercina L-15889]|uniref:Uncharacterized protein n=1 Tax=Daedalea quercina L-15889 TaxID=1314783 RepID=A0A165S624_9APHY|nr:hypothetical protein DAEQUDRAFT_113093 [Daedalea quercina L-15889]